MDDLLLEDLTQEDFFSLESGSEEEDSPVSWTEEAASQQAARTSVVLGRNLTSDYEQTKQELVETGGSQTKKEAENLVDFLEEQEVKDVAENIITDPNLTVEQKTSTLKAVSQISNAFTLDVKDALKLQREFEKTAPFIGEAPTDAGETELQNLRALEAPHDPDEALQAFFEELQGAAANEEAFALAVDAFFQDTNINSNAEAIARGTADAVEAIVPISFAKTVKDVYETVVGTPWKGRIVPGQEYVATGSILADLRDKFNSLPAGEKASFAKKLGAALKKNSGIIKDGNALEAMMVIDSVINRPDLLENPDSIDWEKWTGNLFALLDVVAAGAILRSVSRMSVAGTLKRANPKLYRSVKAASLLDESGEANKALGVSKEKAVIESEAPAMPGRQDNNLEGAPVDILIEAKRLEGEYQNILLDAKHAPLPDEALVADRIYEYGGGRLHINKTKFERIDDDNIKISVTVGKDPVNGFSSIESLKASVKRFLGEEALRSIEVYKKSPKTGKLNKVKRPDKLPPKEKGEFFYRFEKVERAPRENPLAEANLDLKQIDDKFLGVSLGSAARYFKDVRALFNKETSFILNRLTDREVAVQQAQKQMLRTFNKLKTPSQEKVLQTLVNGSKMRKEFSPRELLEGTGELPRLSKEEVVAFMEIRKVSDLNYAIKNIKAHRELKAKGYEAIKMPDEYHLFGKRVAADALEDELKGVARVLDANSGKLTDMDPNLFKDIKQGKAVVFRLRGTEAFGLERTNLAVVKTSSLHEKVGPIPATVIPKIPGYVYRGYEDMAFIEKIDPRITVNGKKVDTPEAFAGVIKSAPDEVTAASYVEDLMKNRTIEEIEAGVTYRYRLGREFIQKQDSLPSYDFAKMNGLLHTGKRGKVLSSVEEDAPRLISVVESLGKTLSETARKVAIEDPIRALEENFVKTYDDFIIGPPGRKSFPDSVEAFRPAKTSKEAKEIAKAKAAWEWINFVGRYSDPVTRQWRSYMISIANTFDEMKNIPFNRKIGDVFRWLAKRNTDPLDAIKSFAFTQFIGLNPTRQALLQMSQHLMVAPLAPKYVASGALYRDAAALMLGTALRNTKHFRDYSLFVSKRMGITRAEFVQMVDDWKASGLPAAIDSHNFLAGIKFESESLVGRKGIEKAAVASANILKTPVRVARKLGFNAGEHANLALTWVLARKLLQKEGKKLTRDAVAAKARDLSTVMNRAGEFKYQRGILKATTQFLAFNHKALLSVLPERLGGVKTLSASEKVRVSVPSLLMFGLEGFGLGKLGVLAVEKYAEVAGEPMPQELADSVVYGLGTTAINELIQEFTGDDTRIDFSAFSPYGGTFMLNSVLWDFLFSADESVLAKMLGPSGSALSRTWREFKSAADILMVPGAPGWEDNLKEALKRIGAGLSSGLNNYFKVQLASDGKAKLLNGEWKEIPEIEATYAEAIAKMSLGLSPLDLKWYYEIKHNAEERKKHIREQAKSIVNATLGLMSGKEFSSPGQLISITRESWNTIGAIVDKEDREAVRKLFIEGIRRAAENGNIEAQRFLTTMIDTGEPLPRVLARAQALLPPDKYEAFKNIMEEITAEPSSTLPINAEEDEE